MTIYIKTQRKIVSDFPEKIVEISPLWSLFRFVAKFFFSSNFPKKCRIFFNEIDCKKFLKFFTVNFIEKKFDIFSGNLKKKIFATKRKTGHRGEKSQQFFQENPTPPFVGFWRDLSMIYIQYFWERSVCTSASFQAFTILVCQFYCTCLRWTVRLSWYFFYIRCTCFLVQNQLEDWSYCFII